MLCINIINRYLSANKACFDTFTVQINVHFFIPQSHCRNMSPFFCMFPTLLTYSILFVAILLPR